ncbi:hypothetical protein [Photobacterium kasasachensis]|uniref:hypothetical protein n=1 Tax=Photobacterium kasasachensis TaxID=2910240 RepID=UPI003D0F11CD
MNCFRVVFLLLVSILSFQVTAEVEQSDRFNEYFESKIVLETIENLADDGFITDRNAIDAKDKYVFSNEDLKARMDASIAPASSAQIDKEISWGEYIHFVNLLKFCAVMFLLVAFRGFVAHFISSIIGIIASIPSAVYQITLLMFSLLITIIPEVFWASETLYLALLGSIANLIILSWVGYDYHVTVNKIIRLISIGVKPHVLVPTYLALYFGSLAIWYQSNIFGVIAVACVLAAMGFVIIFSGLCVTMGVDDERVLPTLILVNFITLLTYSLIIILGYSIPYLEYFTVGVEYLCSLVLGVCLLISTSPLYKHSQFFTRAIIMMVVSGGLSVCGSVFYSLDVIPQFINTFFMLFLLGWVVELTKKAGFIALCFVVGCALYGFAIMLERHPAYFITSLI